MSTPQLAPQVSLASSPVYDRTLSHPLMKLKRLQSAYRDPRRGNWKCRHCPHVYPEPNPNSRVRRHHKKICPGQSAEDSAGKDEGGDSVSHDVSGGPMDASQTGDKDRETSPGGEISSQGVLSQEKAEVNLMDNLVVPQNSSQEGAEGKLIDINDDLRVAHDVSQVKPDVNWMDVSNEPFASQVLSEEAMREQTAGERELASDALISTADKGGETGDARRGRREGEAQEVESEKAREAQEVESERAREAKEVESEVVGATYEAERKSDDNDDYLSVDSEGEGTSSYESSPLGTGSPSQSDVPDMVLEPPTSAAEEQHEIDVRKAKLGEAEKDLGRRDVKLSPPEPFERVQLGGGSEKRRKSEASITSSTAEWDNNLPKPVKFSSDAARSAYLRFEHGKPTTADSELPPLKSLDDEEIAVEGDDVAMRYDIERLLREQKTFDLICPVCGSRITDRVILRKRRRKYVSKKDLELEEAMEITTKGPENATPPKSTADKDDAPGCFGYLPLFSR